MRRIVVALGGNALLPPGESASMLASLRIKFITNRVMLEV
jgi:carbamate kinase